MPVESLKVTENRATLPPPGENPDGSPTRSETQFIQGAQGRMTMRIVALDLGVRKTSYCELSQGQVVQRTTVCEFESLKPLLGPDQPTAKVAIEACREAWFVHDLLVEWGNEVVLVDTTRSRQMGIGQHGRKTDRIDAETLARALEAGRIPRAHVLSPSRRELRRVLGVRRRSASATGHNRARVSTRTGRKDSELRHRMFCQQGPGATAGIGHRPAHRATAHIGAKY